MALPPIISNLPIIKLFKSDASAAQSNKTQSTSGANAPVDVIEISETARKKLSEAQEGEIKTDKQARKVSGETGALLSENEDETLGLDPQFAANES